MDPRITFTRASTATYYGTQTALAEQNLLLYSQEFDNAYWAKQNTTVIANAISAPDGTTTADNLDDGVETGSHSVSGTFSGTAGVTYTLSAFFRNLDRQYVILACSAGANTWASAKFDLSSGSPGLTSESGSGWLTTSASIESVGGSWYRCIITFVSGSTATLSTHLGMATDAVTFTAAQNGLESYTGSNRQIFIWGAQLEQRSTATAYTPTTTQAITNYIPVLETAAIDAPRFDYTPTTQTALGLLIEEQRTNLLTYSEQFDNAAWTKTRSSITANIVVAPDGAITGDKLVEDTATGSHTVRNATSVTIVSGTTLTASVFAKAAEGAFVIVGIGDGGGVNISRTTFNLSTGAIGSSATAAANVSVPIPSITPVGNGWYRCAVTATVTIALTAQQWIFKGSNATGAANYTGDGISGIYIWGAQLESGAFITSYIPTVASQVTRSADVAVMTGTNFSTWYNATEGTFFAQFRPLASNFGGNRNIFLATDNSTANFVGLRYASSGAQTVLAATTSGTSQANIATGTMVAGTSYQLAGAYKVNDFAASRDSGTVVTDTSGTLPVVSRAEIGCLAGAGIGSQHIAKLVYYPRRLSNAELQAITA